MVKYLTVVEVADLLRVHPETVRVYLKKGKIKGLKLDREWRISENALSLFLKAGERVAQETTEVNLSKGK